jgi:hypothetical protein
LLETVDVFRLEELVWCDGRYREGCVLKPQVLHDVVVGDVRRKEAFFVGFVDEELRHLSPFRGNGGNATLAVMPTGEVGIMQAGDYRKCREPHKGVLHYRGGGGGGAM